MVILIPSCILSLDEIPKRWAYLSVKEAAIVAVTLLLTKMHLAFAIHHGGTT